MQIKTSAFVDYDYGVTAIDVEFKTDGFAASHLIVEGDSVALVDCGTNYSVPNIMSVLAKKNIAPEQVEYLMLTHVHLDHAGGAGLLMQKLPRATMLIHPRGARHMIDPRILYASAGAVYGESEMAKTYGQLIPVPKERVQPMQDGSVAYLNGREFQFIDTPGHARHHVCIFDSKSRGFFTGDTFGLSYRPFDNAGEPFIFPTTTPPQFDPEAAHDSIERILSFNPECVYLTHYGKLTDVARLSVDLHECLDAFVELGLRVQDTGHARHRLLRDGLTHILLGRLHDQGKKIPPELIQQYLQMDIELNAQGIEIWLDALPR